MPDRDQPNIASRTICPYCGHAQQSRRECESCKGLFEPLSRQATQNAMGPWQLRDPEHPFKPPFSYRTLRNMVRRGRITADSILRGPTTNQFWRAAGQTAGVAHLLGRCHNCGGDATANDFMCSTCGASFAVEDDRQFLGLSPIRPLEGAESQLPGGAAAVTAPTITGPSIAARGPAVAFPFGDPDPTGAGGGGDILPPRSRRNSSRAGMAAATLIVFALAVASVVVLVVQQPWRQVAAPAAAPDAQPAELEVIESDDSARPDGEAAGAGEEAAAASVWQSRMDAAVERGDEDTIEAVEGAVEELRAILREAPSEEVPSGLAAELERLQARLDLLRVRRFL